MIVSLMGANHDILIAASPVKMKNPWLHGYLSSYVLETIVAMEGGVDRIIVEVRAVNASSEAEPWVDISNAGTGLVDWRLDVGSTLGGTDPIHPDTSP